LFEHDPALSINRIEMALRGQLSPDTLTGEQQEQYLDRLEDDQWQDSPAVRQAFGDLVAKQGGVGYASEDSNDIVTVAPTRR
jgi:hypothetical protein